jgi:hypothetical protein
VTSDAVVGLRLWAQDLSGEEFGQGLGVAVTLGRSPSYPWQPHVLMNGLQVVHAPPPRIINSMPQETWTAAARRLSQNTRRRCLDVWRQTDLTER